MVSEAQRLEVVRRAVRAVIDRTPELRERPALRRRLAEQMVGVSATAAALIDEEHRQDRRLDRHVARRGRAPQPRGRRERAPLAAAQAAGDQHRRTAVSAAPGALRAARDAIAFPEFVTSLISGVFQSITTSTIQQLEAYTELLQAVTLTSEDFGVQHITDARAVEWAATRFPELAVQIAGAGEPPRLTVREGADMPEEDVVMRAVGATRDEASSIDEDELNETLVPLVRRKLARDRQAMLSTMVMLGMQRIVVDEGRLHASMDLRVDARSLSEQTEGSQFDSRVSTAASGSFGTGMWGASASVSATVGYVKTDEQYTREDLALTAGLRSSVDLAFRTDQIPLDRFASRARIRSIDQQQMVPGSGLLTNVDRQTSATHQRPPGVPPEAPDPGSEEQRALRARQDFGPAESSDDASSSSGDTASEPAADAGGGEGAGAPANEGEGP